MALTISPDQEHWTDAQRQALTEVIIGDPRQATEAMLDQLLHVCQRTHLDPWARQIYLRIQGGRGGARATMQTSIDGLRLIAQRAARDTGARLGYQPQLWCGPDGQWVDVWLHDQPPAAARCDLTIGDAAYSAVALWSEYGQDSPIWRRMPALMLSKVAEALALRRACPADLSGLYTGDEMPQTAPPQTAPQTQAPQAPPPESAPQAQSESAPQPQTHLDWGPITDLITGGIDRDTVLAAAGQILGLDGPATTLRQLTSQDQINLVAARAGGAFDGTGASMTRE